MLARERGKTMTERIPDRDAPPVGRCEHHPGRSGPAPRLSSPQAARPHNGLVARAPESGRYPGAMSEDRLLAEDAPLWSTFTARGEVLGAVLTIVSVLNLGASGAWLYGAPILMPGGWLGFWITVITFALLLAVGTSVLYRALLSRALADGEADHRAIADARAHKH